MRPEVAIVDDHKRAIEIERLRRELSEATARRAALVEEGQELFARLHDIRAAFGNTFFYSHPEHADGSAASYTGPSSHQVVAPTAVFNRTRLTGTFDVDVEFDTAPDAPPPAPPSIPFEFLPQGLSPGSDALGEAATEHGYSSSQFDVISKQLGLKLEATRGPGDVLVIDHVEHPAED